MESGNTVSAPSDEYEALLGAVLMEHNLPSTNDVNALVSNDDEETCKEKLEAYFHQQVKVYKKWKLNKTMPRRARTKRTTRF